MAYFKLIPDDKVVLKKLAELQDRSADPHNIKCMGGRSMIK